MSEALETAVGYAAMLGVTILVGAIIGGALP
jgi:hypothetical protein